MQPPTKGALAGTSLVVQRVGLRAPTAGGPGSIPGPGTKSHMHAATKSSHTAIKKSACHIEDPECRNLDMAQPK